MGPGPITYQEIDAYRRMTLDDLTAWEVRLIKRVDIAVLVAASGDSPTQKPTGEPAGIPVNDPKSLKCLLRGIAKSRKERASD